MVVPTALGLALAGTATIALGARTRAVSLDRLRGRRTEPVRPARWRHPGRPGPPSGSDRWRTSDVCGLAVAVAVALLVGMPAGVPAGIAAGWGTARWCGRRESTGDRQTERARRAELPAVLDLLAVCLSAGLPLAVALDLVATALPGAFSAELQTVAALHRLGAGPAVAWNEVRTNSLLGPVARAAIRSGESGSALALAFERLATEHRADDTLRCEAQARRAGVLAMAPLGLCFLPAFVCLGIVPVVLGIAHQVLGATVTGPAGLR